MVEQHTRAPNRKHSRDKADNRTPSRAYSLEMFRSSLLFCKFRYISPRFFNSKAVERPNTPAPIMAMLLWTLVMVGGRDSQQSTSA